MTTTETKLIKLTPSEGMWLNKGDIISDCVYLGINDSPDNWREMSNFKDNAVLLVLASEGYDPNDYIRDYDEFIAHNQKKYGVKK